MAALRFDKSTSASRIRVHASSSELTTLSNFGKPFLIICTRHVPLESFLGVAILPFQKTSLSLNKFTRIIVNLYKTQ